MHRKAASRRQTGRLASDANAARIRRELVSWQVEEWANVNPGSITGDLGTSHVLWGSTWAVVLFGLAVWWGTSVFRKENA